MSEFYTFVKKVCPKALPRQRSYISFPKEDPAVLFQKFLDAGCERQKMEWCPVSKAQAVRAFSDPEEEGNYYMQITINGEFYQFMIQSNGEGMYYV